MSSEPQITPEMIARYISRRREDLTKLRAALSESDFETLQSIAHQIKGNAATFSFVDLEAFAITLEASAEAKHIGACREQVENIEHWLDVQSGSPQQSS